jgi:hypothetical protein
MFDHQCSSFLPNTCLFIDRQKHLLAAAAAAEQAEHSGCAAAPAAMHFQVLADK